MTPYRTRACIDTDDAMAPMACSEEPFGAGCPTCGACVERVTDDARRTARRSRWTFAFGALATVALLLTSYASLRVLQVASRTLHRLDRHEGRRAAAQLKAMTTLLRESAKTMPGPKPPPGHHHGHHHGHQPPALTAPALPTPEPPVPTTGLTATTLYGLEAFGAPTQNPLELRRRAQKINEAGLALPVFRTHVSGTELKTMLTSAPHAIVLTPSILGGSTLGVRISHLPPPFLAAGLRDGDLLTSLNGVRLKSAADVTDAFGPFHGTGPRVAIVELVRADRPMVVDVSFTE